MNSMFYNCKSLKFISDISYWNTNNATDMKKLFYNCTSLLSLPNLETVIYQKDLRIF